MKASILEITKEVQKGEEVNLDEQILIGGKLAGICYMADDYFSNKINNEESALKRASQTTKSGHHSVFDHGNITLQLEGLPKIIAMLLNSLGMYATSEKSARYTIMKPETELEETLYNKWQEKFKDKIQEVYADIEDVQAQKLAQENARYLISVFTPTVMAYTTSYRQWNYIMQWVGELIKAIKGVEGEFNRKLEKSLEEFLGTLKGIFGEVKIHDTKNRRIEFVPMQYGDKFDSIVPHFGNTYETQYKLSFAGLAQGHRHRTLEYIMQFSGKLDDMTNFYVPMIIRGTDLEKEWLDDINSVKYCIPQGTLVDVIERGTARNFFLKCTERLCGRAQLEIMRNTLSTLIAFKEFKYNLSNYNSNILDSIISNGYVPKCGFKGFSCTEGCRWGKDNAFKRLV